MLAEALYLDFHDTMPVATRDFFRWLTFLLCTPVVFYSGWPFIAGALRELRERRLGMDVLVAGSTLLAYFASLFETIRGGEHVWYDAAVMFVFLLLAARMLEQRARSVASAGSTRWRARALRSPPARRPTEADARPCRWPRCSPATWPAWPPAKRCPPMACCWARMAPTPKRGSRRRC